MAITIGTIKGVLGERLRRHLRASIVIVSFALGLSITLAVLLPNVYRAEATLVPTINESRMEGGVGTASRDNLGALASRFGVSVGRAAGDGQPEVIATLKSRSFLEQFISDHSLLPVIFSDRWNQDAEAWVVDQEDIPTLADGYRKFDEDIMEVRSDIQTGLVSLRIDWSDPVLAADWANDLIARINRLMRDKAIAEADGSLAYINSELSRQQPMELRDVFYRLVESNLTKISMAKGREEYAFRIIDSAKPAELDEPIRPKRLIIVFIGLIFGTFAAIVVAWMREVLHEPPTVGPA